MSRLFTKKAFAFAALLLVGALPSHAAKLVVSESQGVVDGKAAEVTVKFVMENDDTTTTAKGFTWSIKFDQTKMSLKDGGIAYNTGIFGAGWVNSSFKDEDASDGTLAGDWTNFAGSIPVESGQEYLLATYSFESSEAGTVIVDIDNDDYNHVTDGTTLTSIIANVYSNDNGYGPSGGTFTSGEAEFIRLFSAIDDGSEETPLTMSEDETDVAKRTFDVVANDLNVDENTNPVSRDITVEGLAISSSGDPTYVTSLTIPDQGVAEVVNNKVVFTPAQHFFTTDTPVRFVYKAKVTIDAAEVSDTATIYIDVTAVNDKPVITGSFRQTTLEDKAITLTKSMFTISDVDNDDEDISLIVLPGTDYTFSGNIVTPDKDFNGDLTVNVKVNDGNLDSDNGTIIVSVTPVNDAPTISDISNPADILESASEQTINLSGITDGDPRANPEDNQTITVTAESSNTALIPNPTVTYTSGETSGSLKYTPVAKANGRATITVTVTDNGGSANGGINETTETFEVNVTAVNNAPTINVIADPVAILEDALEQTINLAGITDGDPELSQTLRVTAVSSKADLIPNPTVTYTSSNATGTLKYTPVADANGTATITVKVSDNGKDGTANGDVNFVTKTFDVEVTAVNDEPVVDKGVDDQTATQDIAFNYPVPADAFDDADIVTNEDKLTLTTSALPAWLSFDGSKFSGTPLNADVTVSPLTITVTATDKAGDDVSTTFDLTVLNVNDAPVISGVDTINPTYYATVAEANSNGFTVPLDKLSVVDIDTEDTGANITVSYTWSVERFGDDNPDDVSGSFLVNDAPDSLIFNPKTFVQYDTVKLTIKASDNESLDSNEIVLVASIENMPPSLVESSADPSSLKVVENVPGEVTNKIVFTAKFADGSLPQDSGVDSITWQVLKNNIVVDEKVDTDTAVQSGESGLSTFTFTPDQNFQTHGDDNQYVVRAFANDGSESKVKSENKDWVIDVDDANNTPKIGSTAVAITPDPAFTTDKLVATVTKGATDEDAEDRDGLVYVVEWFNKSTPKTIIQTDNLEGDNVTSTLSLASTLKNNTFVAKVTVYDGRPPVGANYPKVATGSKEAEITISNSAPAANGEDVDQTANEDSAKTYLGTDLVKAFTDADEDNLAITDVTTTKGKVTLDNGDVIFDPNGKFENLDDGDTPEDVTVTMIVTDGDVNDPKTANDTFTVSVSGVNDAPVVDSIKIEARNGSDKVPTSKPEEITSLVAIVNASDVDDNDSKLDTKNVKFVLTRKGDSSPHEYLVTDIEGFDKTLPLNISATPADFSLSEFMKDDKVEVFVTVNDTTVDSAENSKRITIGNPPWFPALDLADFVSSGLENGAYRLVYTEVVSDFDAAVVDMSVDEGDTEVTPRDYINGSWNYAIAGLKPGVDYTISSVKMYNDATMEFDQDVPVTDDEFTVEDYGVAAAKEGSVTDYNLGLTNKEDSNNVVNVDPGEFFSLESVPFKSEPTNAFVFRAELEDVSGYTYTLTSDSISKSTTVFFTPNSEDELSTSASVVKTETLTESGSYTFTVTPINPKPADDEDPVKPYQITFEFDANIYGEPNVNPGNGLEVNWTEMVPGGGYTVAAPENVGKPQSGDKKDVSFSWPAVPWAENYLIYLATADGKDIPGLGRIPATEPKATVALAPGLYKWHVIARNEQAGYSEEWSEVAWFIVDSNGAVKPSASGAQFMFKGSKEVSVFGIEDALYVQIYVIEMVDFATTDDKGQPVTVKAPKSLGFFDKVTLGGNNAYNVTLTQALGSGEYEVHVNAVGEGNLGTGWVKCKEAQSIPAGPGLD